MSLFKKLIDPFLPNPFDKLLKQMVPEDKTRFLVVWNRGLGDIPLGLYALIYRIRSYIPHASITFLTRKDLADLFTMLDDVHVIVDASMKRGKSVNIGESLKEHQLSSNMFDVILEKPDPTRWLKWQLGSLIPKLSWNPEWDLLVDKYDLDPNATYIGCHVQTETGVYYGYEKNWDLLSWQTLFKRIHEENKGKILLFGVGKGPEFLMKNVIDLRGKTHLFEMLALIKNRCRYLVAPDSGVLSVAYYIDSCFPIRVVSLWADPKQGVLRQNVDSPNSEFEHIPLIGKNQKVSSITTDEVYNALFGQYV
jgi:ADP-heptose:LPS heptosyltransferase